LKNGKKIISNSDERNGRYVYLYNYKPNNNIEEIKRFKELLVKMGYIEEFNGYTTKFSKRKYIDDYHYFKIRLYEDEFDYITIQHIYKTIEKPDIKQLIKDLDFYKYSELVFDRERELREMLISI